MSESGRTSRAVAAAALCVMVVGTGAQSPAGPDFHYGAPVDVGAFAYRRDIPAGAAGIAELRLDAAALAHCRSQFADLRIVAGDGRQVPYLIAKMNEPLAIRLSHLERDTSPPGASAGGERARGTVSRYVIRLPYPKLPPAQLVLTTTARMFTRTLILQADPGPADKAPDTLGVATWQHAMPDTDASPLTFTIESLQSTTLRLIVQEGDNAPLPIGVPTLLLPGYRVRFVRPANVPLQLVYGNRELEPARYDLVLAARWLVTSPAQEVVPGPEPRTTTNALPAGIIFWSALVAAVVVLLALVGRLVAAKP